MNTRILRLVFTRAALLPLLLAQSDVARIAGTVTDPTGGVIPAAVITLKNEKTGQSQKVTAGTQGYFAATQLPPAVYSVKAEAAGMATSEFTGIALQVGQEKI